MRLPKCPKYFSIHSAFLLHRQRVIKVRNLVACRISVAEYIPEFLKDGDT